MLSPWIGLTGTGENTQSPESVNIKLSETEAVMMEATMKVKQNVWIPWVLIVMLVASGLALGAVSANAAGRGYPDPAYCDSHARNYADRHTSAGRDVVGGAVGGAAGGALLGGIIGGGKGAGKGAAIGAGVGAVGGGAHAAQSWDHNYRRAYDSCMSGR